MVRFLEPVISYIRDLVIVAARAWTGFFFTEADPTPLGLIRILTGGLLLWNLAVLGLDLHDYLGADGWIAPESLAQYYAAASPLAWSFWSVVPETWLPMAWVASLLTVGAFTLGIGSRATAVMTWAIAVSTARRMPVAVYGFDQMITLLTFYLAAFGASGQALSLDRRLAGATGPHRHTVTANLSLRLIQLHLTLIYASSGLAKLMGPEWWDGSAIRMILLTPEFARQDYSWVLKYPLIIDFATHATIALELGYPLMIWNRRLRPLALTGIIAMHLGIDLILGITEFCLTMMAANIAFISGDALRSVLFAFQNKGSTDRKRRILTKGRSTKYPITP